MLPRIKQQIAKILSRPIPYQITVIGTGTNVRENYCWSVVDREYKYNLLAAFLGDRIWPTIYNLRIFGDTAIASHQYGTWSSKIIPDEYSRLPMNRDGNQPSLAVHLSHDADAVIVVIDGTNLGSYDTAWKEVAKLRENNTTQLIYILMIRTSENRVEESKVLQLASYYKATALVGYTRPDMFHIHQFACEFGIVIRHTISRDLDQSFQARKDSLFSIFKEMLGNFFSTLKNLIIKKKAALPASSSASPSLTTTSRTCATLGFKPPHSYVGDQAENNAVNKTPPPSSQSPTITSTNEHPLGPRKGKLKAYRL